MTIKQILSDKLAKLRSYFTKKPVFTGHGFTTSDQSLSTNGEEALRLFRESPKSPPKPGLAKCSANPNMVFTIVGYYLDGEQTMVRIMDPTTDKCYQVSEGLFSKLFILL